MMAQGLHSNCNLSNEWFWCRPTYSTVAPIKGNQMNDLEKSKEEFVAEIAGLRQRLEEMSTAANHTASPAAIAEGERYKTLVREVPEYLYSIEFYNNKLVSTFHSPGCEAITGYTPNEYTENPFLWMEMIHEKDRERVQHFIQGLKEPLTCKSIEHRIVHKDGSVRWVVNMTPYGQQGFNIAPVGFSYRCNRSKRSGRAKQAYLH
jgi:sigma-B regulation protein RsbU (phosphoserine phosphatase)